MLLLCVSGPAFAAAHDDAALPLRPLANPPAAPTLNLDDLQGHPFRFEDLGGRVILVNFWATWCPPCRKEMPALDRLAHRLQGQPFALVGVNVGESPDRIWAFFDSLPAPPGFPVVLDRTGDVSRAWGVKVVPTTWVVDLDRRIVLGTVGEVDFDGAALLGQIRALMEGALPSGHAAAPGAGATDLPHWEPH